MQEIINALVYSTATGICIGIVFGITILALMSILDIIKASSK